MNGTEKIKPELELYVNRIERAKFSISPMPGLYQEVSCAKPGNTEGGSITVLLTDLD